MERLFQQLTEIEAIVDTVSPHQIQDDSATVDRCYKCYAKSYNPLARVERLKYRLFRELDRNKPVTGYLSADYGYGKTATLIYLWNECIKHGIIAIPPFKFKELGDLIQATANWLKWNFSQVQPEFAKEIEQLYQDCQVRSHQQAAMAIAQKYKLSEAKALKIVRDLKSEAANVDLVLEFWQASLKCIKAAGFSGLAIFADETQEFLRTESGASVRIQMLSDLVKGMRAVGSIPVALVLGMPTDPTESAIAEQAGDIIHRMQEQGVSLRLADAYRADFPKTLWESLCDKFLNDTSHSKQFVHPATLESLGQLCARKDLSNGPRTVIEVFKRIVSFTQEQHRPYKPLDLMNDYLDGRIQFYGAGQHRINGTLASLNQLPAVYQHPDGETVMRLLASFPDGVSQAIAEEFGQFNSLQKLVDDDTLYGLHLIQPKRDRFALVALSQPNTPTVVDKILNRFRQAWFREWSDPQKHERASKTFRTELLSLLFPASQSRQKANWTWRSGRIWTADRFGMYTVMTGAPERYADRFPNRTLTLAVGTEDGGLMQFVPPHPTHLDWRFYLSNRRDTLEAPQQLYAIAGTGQVDFQVNLARYFQDGYPLAFGLLRQVIAAEECSVCTLLSLSDYIAEWLEKHADISQAERERLEHHRSECHRYALRLLFPSAPKHWNIEGLDHVRGGDVRFVESVFVRQCQRLFPQYPAFANNLRPTLVKYGAILEKFPLAVRRGRQTYELPKVEFEQVFESKGSSLPSLLALFEHHQLVAEYRLGKKPSDVSTVRLKEHPLETHIRQLLPSGKALSYESMWKSVAAVGYLPEELETALAWSERRRYVEWDRISNQIREATAAVDAAELAAQVGELRDRAREVLEVADSASMSDFYHHLEGLAQQVETGDGDNTELDRLQRQLKQKVLQWEEILAELRRGRQDELAGFQRQFEQLTRDLLLSLAMQPLESDSGLEPCLNNYRLKLERQIRELDRVAWHHAKASRGDSEDVLVLSRQLCDARVAWENLYVQKEKLQQQVAGLEQWRVLARRVEMWKHWLVGDRRRKFDDDFLDRVVSYFDSHGIEGLTAWETLQRPWLELEAEIQGDRQTRRKAFEETRSQYEGLLVQLYENNLEEPPTLHYCLFDEENEAVSYSTLRDMFLNCVRDWCTNQHRAWEKLEQKLLFLAQERQQKVAGLLNRVRPLHEKLKNVLESIEGNLSDVDLLSSRIEEIKKLKYRGKNVEKSIRETNTAAVEINQHRLPLEMNTLIASLRDGISLRELDKRQESDIWESLKLLYQQGYLEITLSKRKR